MALKYWKIGNFVDEINKIADSIDYACNYYDNHGPFDMFRSMQDHNLREKKYSLENCFRHLAGYVQFPDLIISMYKPIPMLLVFLESQQMIMSERVKNRDGRDTDFRTWLTQFEKWYLQKAHFLRIRNSSVIFDL